MVCQTNYEEGNGIYGGECKGIGDEGISKDFNSKKVTCLHITDGKKTWRGATEDILDTQCYFHGDKYLKYIKEEKYVRTYFSNLSL